MNLPLFEYDAQYIPRIKPLRARLSPQMHAWFNESGLGDASNRRASLKKYVLFVIGHRLKHDVEGDRSLVTYQTLAQILQTHRDYPCSKTPELRRKWVQRVINRLGKMPTVTRYKRYIVFDTLLSDHGGDDAICAHHEKAAKTALKKGAARSKRYRDCCKLPTSQPVGQIVTVKTSTLLPSKSDDLYNASPPQKHLRQPRQAVGFAATRPKRATAVSANRAKPHRPTLSLVSIRSQSDKTLAQPTIPGWLKADHARPDFDPRTNSKAKRVYANGPLDAPFVSMMAREHKELAGLSYVALRRRKATNDTLHMACHLMVNSQDTVTKPIGWVMWAERQLRLGKLKYA